MTIEPLLNSNNAADIPQVPRCSNPIGALQKQFAANARTDLTVHLGDITMDGASDPTHLQYAQAFSRCRPRTYRSLTTLLPMPDALIPLSPLETSSADGENETGRERAF